MWGKQLLFIILWLYHNVGAYRVVICFIYQEQT